MPKQSKTRQLVSDRVRFLIRFISKRPTLEGESVSKLTTHQGIKDSLQHMLKFTMVDQSWSSGQSFNTFENHSHSFSLTPSALSVTSSVLGGEHE